MNDKELIRRIKQGDQRAFEKVYTLYKTPFTALMTSKFKTDQNEALDLFQDACSAMYTNITAGKLTPESLKNASLKTYLLNTGKYMLFNRRRKKSAPIVFATDWILNMDEDGDGNVKNVFDKDYLIDPVEEATEMQDKLFIIRESVKLMSSPCKEILTLKFYKKMKAAEIAEQLGDGKTERAVVTQTMRCKDKLKEVVQRRFNECGYDQ